MSSAAHAAIKKERRCVPTTPVGHLSDGDSVDSLVDSFDTFPPVDVHEDGPRSWWLDTRGGDLVTGDLDRLHTGADTFMPSISNMPRNQ